MMTERTDGELETQAVMIIAEVIEAAGEIHACHQGFGAARQSARSSHQVVEPQAKRALRRPMKAVLITPFPYLSNFDQALHHFLAALYNPSGNGQDTLNTLFDNLHNGDV